MVTGATRRSRIPPLWLAGRTRARCGESIINALFHACGFTQRTREGNVQPYSRKFLGIPRGFPTVLSMKVCALALGVPAYVCRPGQARHPSRPDSHPCAARILQRRAGDRSVSYLARYEVARLPHGTRGAAVPARSLDTDPIADVRADAPSLLSRRVGSHQGEAWVMRAAHRQPE